MNIFLLPGVFVTIFILLLLAGKRSKAVSDLYLGFLFGLYTLYLGGTYLHFYNHDHNYPFPASLNTFWLFLFLHGPALWFYIQSLTIREFRFKPVYLLHFIPFLFFLVYHYFNFIQLPVNQKIEIVRTEIFRELWFYRFSVACIGISTISYNIWALLRIRKHRKQIMNELSDIENLDLNWLRTLTVAALIIYSLNVFLFNLNNIYSFSGFRELTYITSVFTTIYVLFLGYFGLQQGQVFVSSPALPAKQINEVKNEEPITPPDQHKEFINQLVYLMEHSQPYLDPGITLAKLSAQLHIRQEYLSEVLNSSLSHNFFDFINKYRVEEFKIQCINKEKRHLSILGIAHECGFNSKASFYRAFGKFEGMSPTAFIQKVSGKSETNIT